MSTPAEKVGYEDVREYLKHRGWVAKPSRSSWSAIYRHGQDAEVVVPIERDLADYGEAIERVARRAAEVEGRTPEAVLNDFLQPRADVVRFALEGDATQGGSIDLAAGVELLQGAKKCLLASAMSALRPVRFHPRMSLSEAEAYVAGCRMGQTEFGSFVLALQTPLYVGSTLDETAAPFGRLATTQLFRATSQLLRAIKQDTVQESILDAAPEASVVSANLCEALIEAMPSDESADLRLQATWSPMVPAPSDVPHDLRVDRDMFQKIESVGQSLRPVEAPARHKFVGYVLQLAGGLAAEGPVTIRALVDAELIDIRIKLDQTAYRQAALAHLQHKMVAGDGELHRRARKHELLNVQTFQVLE